jgi:hypothetical protein
MSIENVILGTLIQAPRFLELINISDNLFSTDKRKRAFQIIARLWEEERPQEIDLTLLASRMGGDGDYSFVSSLLSGLQHLSEENFLSYVTELKKKKISEKINTVSQKNANYHLKHGEVDPELTLELKKLWAEFDSLDVSRGPFIHPLQEIEAKEISWLWEDRIPLGSLTLFVGDPGEGKSILCEFLAAKISKGEHLPGDFRNIAPQNSIFITGEDNLSDTVRPRADDAGADCNRIFVLNDKVSNGIFKIDEHLPLIEKEVDRIGNMALLVLDPITALGIPIFSSTRDEEKTIRARLLPIISLAQRKNLAIIGVHHCNKDSAKKALYRVLGGIDFAAAARAVWLIQRDEDNKRRRFFSSLKSNLSKESPTLAFSINGPQGHPKITFETDPVDITAAEILGNEDFRDHAFQLNEAKTWLGEILKTNPISADKIKELAKKEEISGATLRRAKNALAILSIKKGNEWYWDLP